MLTGSCLHHCGTQNGMEAHCGCPGCRCPQALPMTGDCGYVTPAVKVPMCGLPPRVLRDVTLISWGPVLDPPWPP